MTIAPFLLIAQTLTITSVDPTAPVIECTGTTCKTVVTKMVAIAQAEARIAADRQRLQKDEIRLMLAHSSRGSGGHHSGSHHSGGHHSSGGHGGRRSK